jgi:hypothetical protein
MDDVTNSKKIYQANLHKKRLKGRPKTGWKDDVKNDIRKVANVNLRQVALVRDGWRRATSEAPVLLGEWSHRRRRRRSRF